MAKKTSQPAQPAGYQSRPLPFEPSEDDWTMGVAALRQGKPEIMLGNLQNLDLPLRLITLFETVLNDEALCREVVKAYTEGEVEDLQNQAAGLFRYKPDTLDASIDCAARSREVQKQLANAESRRSYAQLARWQLDALEMAFPELFGKFEQPVRPIHGNAHLPNPTDAIMREFGLDPYRDTWRDCLREPEQRAGLTSRRTLRVTGIASRASEPLK